MGEVINLHDSDDAPSKERLLEMVAEDLDDIEDIIFIFAKKDGSMGIGHTPCRVSELVIAARLLQHYSDGEIFG
jgi:hypothetical protein